LTTFDATIVQVQKSFIKTKTQFLFYFIYFELFNIHISHLALQSMINMVLKWHHKTISNTIIIFIEFWWALDIFLNCLIVTTSFMTNETYQNCTKFTLMKIHKYTNILKVISLNYNLYNSCNHFSKSWGCNILCVYM